MAVLNLYLTEFQRFRTASAVLNSYGKASTRVVTQPAAQAESEATILRLCFPY